MDTVSRHYKPSKTTEFMIQLNKFVFICGLPSFWIEELNFQRNFYKLYQKFNTVANMCILVLFFSELGAFFTQKNLSNKQTSNLILFTVGQGITICYLVSMVYHKPDVKNVIYKLGIGLKKVYNDLEVEELMIKRAKFFSAAVMVNGISSLILMTLQASMSTISTGEPFTTVITVIPDIKDDSTISNVFRGIYNIFWWIHLNRIFSVYTLVICLTTAMSHQFMNLSSYFCSLNNIFTEDNFGTHKEREEKYEKSLKTGIELHSESLKCTNQIQNICKEVFSGQIMLNVILLIVLMYQMVSSDRTLTNTITLLVTAATILLSTGFFLWNAGDITLEAEKLTTSVYFSGWENCYGDCSKRVRKLIVIAMMQAQQPVVLSGFGIIALSYQSYVSIVKSSYTVFSVLY